MKARSGAPVESEPPDGGSPSRVTMRLVSFNPLRTLGMPGVTTLKPEAMRHAEALIRAADWCLFPESWQLNVLCYAFGARVYPSPATYAIGFDKVEMTRAFEAVVPSHVPETMILPGTSLSVELAIDRLGLPLVVKRPRDARGRGVALVDSAAELRRWAEHEPVLYVQEYLPLDGDLRVVWIGDRVLAAYWRRGGDGFRFNLAQGGIEDFSAIPDAALALVTRVATRLGIDHAGFDVAMVDGHPLLLEFNVLFGFEALNRRGISVTEAILAWLRRGFDRAPTGTPVDGPGDPTSLEGPLLPGPSAAGVQRCLVPVEGFEPPTY